MTGVAGRRKGYTANRAVVLYLRDHGFPYAEVRGTGFAGPDVTELGPGLEIEVKNRERWDLSGWLDQLVGDMEAHESPMGALIIKRKGTADVARWWFCQSLGLFDTMAAASGPFNTCTARHQTWQQSTLPKMFDTYVDSTVDVFGQNVAPVFLLGRRGRRPFDDYAITTVGHGVRLLRAAGWGTPLEATT